MIVKNWLLSLMTVKAFHWKKQPGPETAMAINFANILREKTLKGQIIGVWTHIPNEIGWGRNRSSQMVYAIAKNMGMIAGSPDYVFIRPGEGLLLEAKSDSGVMNPDQKNYRLWAEAEGVGYYVFRSADEGLTILEKHGFLRN